MESERAGVHAVKVHDPVEQGRPRFAEGDAHEEIAVGRDAVAQVEVAHAVVHAPAKEARVRDGTAIGDIGEGKLRRGPAGKAVPGLALPRLVVLEDFRAAIDRVDLRIGEGFRDLGERARWVKIVAVQMPNDVARGCAQTLVEGVVKTPVRLANHAQMRVAHEEFHGAIRGHAVHDDVLHAIVVLRQHAPNRLAQKMGAVQAGRDDGDLRRGHGVSEKPGAPAMRRN